MWNIMRSVGGSAAMLRSIIADDAPDRGGRRRGRREDSSALRRLVVVLALLAQLSEVRGKDVSSARILTRSYSSNGTAKDENSSPLANEIMLDSHRDDDDVYLAYSGYLRSGSSMLTDASPNITESNDTSVEAPKAVNGHRRVKRAVTHLYNMIVCATGCNPLAYKGYGCYCGFLGSGYPMDGIDRCCKMHDWCYEATDCPMFVEYFVPYYWKCYRGYKPICAIEHGEWGSSGSCAQRLCECDRSFAECLRRYRCPRHKAVCTSSPWRLIQNIFMII